MMKNNRLNKILILALVSWGVFITPLFARVDPYAVYVQARLKNLEPNGIRLKSYQVQVKNNLIDGILSYAEKNREAFYFPSPTEVTQFWQRDRPLFTRLTGKDAPPAVRDIVNNFLTVSGQVFFYQVYGETEKDIRSEIRRLRRHGRVRMTEDERKYYLVFTPRDEALEINVQDDGFTKLRTEITSLEVDIIKEGLLISRLYNRGSVTVSGTKNYHKQVEVVVEIEYEKKEEIFLVSNIHTYQKESDEFDYSIDYSYTYIDGFYLPKTIKLLQTMVKDGVKKTLEVVTQFLDYKVNQPSSPKAEVEYQDFVKMKQQENDKR